MSGPAALKASLYWEEGTEACIDFLPNQQFKALLDNHESGRQTPRALLARLLPALPASLGLSSDTAGISGTAYTVAVSHPDYHCPEHQQVLVFPRIESVLAVTLPPQREEG